MDKDEKQKTKGWFAQYLAMYEEERKWGNLALLISIIALIITLANGFGKLLM